MFYEKGQFFKGIIGKIGKGTILQRNYRRKKSISYDFTKELL